MLPLSTRETQLVIDPSCDVQSPSAHKTASSPLNLLCGSTKLNIARLTSSKSQIANTPALATKAGWIDTTARSTDHRPTAALSLHANVTFGDSQGSITSLSIRSDVILLSRQIWHSHRFSDNKIMRMTVSKDSKNPIRAGHPRRWPLGVARG